jgi:DnaK suppressor protein
MGYIIPRVFNISIYRELAMNQNLVEELRTQLLTLKTELTQRVDSIKANVAGGLEADSKEQAMQLENREVEDALANEAQDELAMIRSALQRIDSGTFGICTACGTEIDRRRLSAQPYAGKCIVCAS